ncbi:hypothetical protein CVT25_014664 [Psilocybe cyanescens]|uniref:SHSP domain-containing protein n=1 Tax=Psilocybe cyanescens TaxID=93625 RepID=A0A409WU37_PSICY|nr:hypothetical protein CVT25_014664 [Psilocybe cyanescens]
MKSTNYYYSLTTPSITHTKCRTSSSEPYYDIDCFFEESFSGPASTEGTPAKVRGTLTGLMDLHENSEKNIITASFDFPGATKEDLQIEVHNEKFTVSAETKQSTENDENGYAEMIAAIGNGVLTVTFPKSASELAPKKITIS